MLYKVTMSLCLLFIFCTIIPNNNEFVFVEQILNEFYDIMFKFELDLIVVKLNIFLIAP